MCVYVCTPTCFGYKSAASYHHCKERMMMAKFVEFCVLYYGDMLRTKCIIYRRNFRVLDESSWERSEKRVLQSYNLLKTEQ